MIIAGDINYNGNDNPTGWWVRQSAFFNKLFQDPAFKAKVINRWNTVKVGLADSLMNNIDQTAAYINLSQQRNFARWNILNTYVWPNAVVLGTYDAEIQYLKNWLNTRIDWMNANMRN